VFIPCRVKGDVHAREQHDSLRNITALMGLLCVWWLW
jgi:hypothetical protein